MLVPPTLDRESVKKAIDGLHLANYTAIGEAIFSSLDAIRVFSQATTAKGDKAPPGADRTAQRRIEHDRPLDRRTRSPRRRKAHVQVSTIAFGTPNGTVVGENGEQVPVPADDAGAESDRRSRPAAAFHTATSEQELRAVYKDIGSQIGYTTKHRDISWRFLAVGLLFTLAAAGASMLWSGRLT